MPAANQTSQILRVSQAGHIHVEAGGHCPVGGIFGILGKAVSLQRADCPGIGDNEALKSPILAQNIGKEPMVSGGGHIVEVHVGAHEAAGAGLFCCVEGNEVDILHQNFGNVDRVIVAAAFSCAVAGEVLDAHEDAVGAERLTLKSTDLCAGHRRAQVRIFAGALHDASPTRISCNVDHWGEGPADAGGTGVFAGQVLRGFFYPRIPGCSHRQGNGEDGSISVDDVECKEDGDVEAGLIDRQVLQAIDLLDVDEPEDGANFALDDEVVGLLTG